MENYNKGGMSERDSGHKEITLYLFGEKEDNN
jgi:hypothetical protein